MSKLRISGFDLDEWCDYWQRGNSSDRQDEIAGEEAREELAQAADVVRSLLAANAALHKRPDQLEYKIGEMKQ